MLGQSRWMQVTCKWYIHHTILSYCGDIYDFRACHIRTCFACKYTASSSRYLCNSWCWCNWWYLLLISFISDRSSRTCFVCELLTARPPGHMAIKTLRSHKSPFHQQDVAVRKHASYPNFTNCTLRRVTDKVYIWSAWGPHFQHNCYSEPQRT